MGARSELIMQKCKGRAKTSCVPLRLCTKSNSKPDINILRQIDDSFLDLMEQAGGHLEIRHIAWSNQDLLIRANKQNVSAATCFLNKKIANKAIKQNILKNAHHILKWINNSNSPKREVFEFNHKYIVGKGVKRKSKHVVYGLTRTRVVLQKDPRIKYGFRIITGYCVLIG